VRNFEEIGESKSYSPLHTRKNRWSKPSITC